MNALVLISEISKRGRGRPAIEFDQDIADEIIERLSNGEFMVEICADPRMPSVTTMHKWTTTNPQFFESVARARDLGSDCHVERGVLIAITPHDGRSVTYRSDGSMEMRREDAVQARKLAAWGYFEAAKKLNPAKYGDKVAHVGGSASDPAIKHAVDVAVTMAPRDASEAYIDSLRDDA